MVKIYTKTGDKGETSLFGGTRVLKSSIRVEAYGSVDELNSTIGVVIAQLSIINFQFSNKSQITNLKKELTQIQSDLFEIGSALANPATTYNLQLTTLEKRVGEFEEMIDEMTKVLPVLRNFILPGGGILGAKLHLVRAVCRRAERRIVELAQKEKVDKSILIYFNRLSDLLFTIARFVNFKEGQKETVWKKSNS